MTVQVLRPNLKKSICKRKTQTTIYFKSRKGKDSNHETISNEPESEKTIEQPTRPKRNKKLK